MDEFINNKILRIYNIIKQVFGYRWIKICEKFNLENNKDYLLEEVKSVIYDKLVYIYENDLFHIYCDEYLFYIIKNTFKGMAYDIYPDFRQYLINLSEKLDFEKDEKTPGYLCYNYALFMHFCLEKNINIRNNEKQYELVSDYYFYFQKDIGNKCCGIIDMNKSDVLALICAYIYINKIDITLRDVYENSIIDTNNFYEWLELNGLINNRNHLYTTEFIELIPSLLSKDKKSNIK